MIQTGQQIASAVSDFSVGSIFHHFCGLICGQGLQFFPNGFCLHLYAADFQRFLGGFCNPCQILKLAIVRILEGLPSRPWLRPILQIHDELTFLIPKDRLQEAVAFVKGCMEQQPFPELDLPLVAEASAGESFGNLEELEE